jgi:hypothetical protein
MGDVIPLPVIFHDSEGFREQEAERLRIMSKPVGQMVERKRRGRKMLPDAILPAEVDEPSNG